MYFNLNIPQSALLNALFKDWFWCGCVCISTVHIYCKMQYINKSMWTPDYNTHLLYVQANNRMQVLVAHRRLHSSGKVVR